MHQDTCAWPGCTRRDIRKGFTVCFRDWKKASAEGRTNEFAVPSERDCAHCGKPMPASKAKSAVVCSRPCNHALWKSRNPERVVSAHRRDYEQQTDKVRARATAWYAENTDRARENVRAWKAANPDRKASLDELARVRRRFRLAQVADGPIDRPAVWDRDNGICWICEEPVDPTLAHPHPMSRSIDHVVALAKGGRHCMDNVALAHLGCNCSKQHKTLDRYPRWWAEVVPGATA